MLKKLRHFWGRQTRRRPEEVSFPEIFEHFQILLEDHQQAMELIADLGEKSGGDYVFDRQYIIDSVRELHDLLLRMINGLNLIASNRYLELYTILDRIFLPLEAELRGRLSLTEEMPFVASLEAMPLDAPELTGEKAASLAEVLQRLGLSVPEGFVITTRSYRRFLEDNRLEGRVHALLESWLSGELDEGQAARQIQYAILAGVLPQRLAREIAQHAEKRSHAWAVRSSAYGEDGEFSFAGLHESFLQVPPNEVAQAYVRVLVSLFSPEALAYRRRKNLMAEEAAMAVLCQKTIQSRASGVIHSLDLRVDGPEALVIYATLGLGRTVVEGRSTPDRFVIDRNPPHRVFAAEVAEKKTLLRAAAGGGEEEVPVPVDAQSRPSISEETILTMARWTLALERYFKYPLEIEWSQDEEGRCWILQTRRLHFSQRTSPSEADIRESCSGYRVLVRDRGVVAHGGVGAGPVFIVRSKEEMEHFPEGAVLVSPHTAPFLAAIVPKASAVIAERGSAAGHLATIAREFRVPALFGVDDAGRYLPEGSEVTLDTNQRVIYEGRVQELLRYELIQSTAFEDAPEFRLMRRILRRVAPLSLVDPQAANFVAQRCKTAHDMIRFIHEKAVQELTDLPRFLTRSKEMKIWSLASAIPLDLKILDLGGGVDPGTKGKKLSEDQIRSHPLRALWSGISSPGVWSTEPVPVDFKGMMASLTKTQTEAPGSPSYSGLNLAVVGDAYMNLHLHLGYHFNLIDARAESDASRNHIYFRFVGGVTEITRRSRRAQLLSAILSSCHFTVRTKGDLVVAQITQLAREEVLNLLEILGCLIGYTRQLDIRLRSDQDVPRYVQAFLDQHVSGDPVPGKRRKA